MMGARLVSIALAGLGGALGSCLRVGLSLGALHWLDAAFLWATLAANLSGAALIGWLSVRALGPKARAFWMTGFCGGLTTFSMLSAEVLVLASRSDWGLIGGYLAISALGSVLAAGVGRRVGQGGSSRP